MNATHLLDLSRLQFATTAMYHFLFVPLTLGLSILIAIMESVYVMTGRTVWREMTRMRAFNPMISMLSVGELLLTPRGLVSLAQRSLRTVKQQVKAIEDVGAEIAVGGRELLGRQKSKDE